MELSISVMLHGFRYMVFMDALLFVEYIAQPKVMTELECHDFIIIVKGLGNI